MLDSFPRLPALSTITRSVALEAASAPSQEQKKPYSRGCGSGKEETMRTRYGEHTPTPAG